MCNPLVFCSTWKITSQPANNDFFCGLLKIGKGQWQSGWLVSKGDYTTCFVRWIVIVLNQPVYWYRMAVSLMAQLKTLYMCFTRGWDNVRFASSWDFLSPCFSSFPSTWNLSLHWWMKHYCSVLWCIPRSSKYTRKNCVLHHYFSTFTIFWW